MNIDRDDEYATRYEAAPTIEFKEFRRKQIAELADWCEGFDMTGVSVSNADKQAGSPKIGDKIARNPKNHADRWLIAADYFADNFEPVEKLAALESQPDAPVGFIVRGNSSGDVWFEWAQNSIVNKLDQLIPLGKSAPVFLSTTKPEVKSLEKHCSFHGGYGLKKNCIDCNTALEKPVPVEPAQSQYDKLMSGVEEKDPVERLRFFCSLAMNGQDWLDVEPFFDDVQSALQRAQEDGNGFRDKAAQYAQCLAKTSMELGVAERAYASMEEANAENVRRAEKAESLNRRMVELLKEPSEGMINAGYPPNDERAQSWGVTEVFKAMSDELLKEVEK